MNQSCLNFDGETFNPELDGKRLKTQYDHVFDVMSDGKWRSLLDIRLLLIARGINATDPGVSARLRDFRKLKHGGHTVNRKRAGDPRSGLYIYQLVVRK